MSIHTGSLLFSGLASLILGGLVYLQGRNKTPHIFLALNSLMVAVWCLGQAMGEMVLTKEEVIFWTRVNIGAAILIPPFFLGFILSFLEKLKTERWVLVSAAGGSALLLALDFTPFMVADLRPAAGYRFWPVFSFGYLLFAVFLGVVFLYGLYKLVTAYRRSSGRKRDQILYVLLAALIGIGGGATNFAPIFGLNFPALAHYSMPLYLLLTIYAILEHQLLDIRVVIKNSLVYILLTAVLLGSYFVLTLAVRDIPGVGAAGIVFFFALGLALIFDPLRCRLQKLLDPIFFREKLENQRAIEQLSAENRALYRQMLEREKMAAINQLSAGLAHEIKNPLASLKGMTQSLPDNLNDPQFMKDYLEIIPRQLDRINQIIESLLKVGRTSAYVKGEVDLAKLLDDILRLVENQCLKKEIKVIRQIEEIGKIEGDQEALTQAFMNLILNAIDSMTQGGELKVEVKRAGDRIGIFISDTGSGIRPEDVKKVFDPFFSTKEKGTGMGLAVTYRAIREHKGEIELESELGRGTIFKVWLYTRPKA